MKNSFTTLYTSYICLQTIIYIITNHAYILENHHHLHPTANKTYTKRYLHHDPT